MTSRVKYLLLILALVAIPATVWAISGTQFILKDGTAGGTTSVTATNASGVVTLDGMTELDVGAADITTTGTITSAAGTPTWSLDNGQTLDDGVGDSPAWGVQDATDNYGSIYKANGGNLVIYNDAAAQGISFLTGGDENDYLAITTTTNVPTITSVGTCNFGITSTAALEINTAGAIDFYTSGDTGQYLAWTTAANVPTTTITGTTDWSIQADNAAGELLLQLGADTTNYIKFGTSGSVPYLSVIGAGEFSIITDDPAGEVNIMAGGDTSDYFQFDASGNVPILRTVGTAVMQLEASDDTNDYLTFGVPSNVPTLTAVGDCDFELATAAANYVDISTGGLRLADEEYIGNASDVVTLYADDAAATLAVMGFENFGSVVKLQADQGDDIADTFWITANDSATATMTIGCDNAVKGTEANLLTLSSVGDLIMAGTTPTLTIGDNGTEDSGIVLNNDTDYYFAFDTTGGIAENLLTIGLGSTVGTTPSMGFDASNHTYIINDDATANAVEDVLTIYKAVNAAGVGAAGLGIGIVFNLEDADSQEEQGSIDLVITDATGTAEISDFSFSQQVAGAIENRVLFDGDGPTISAIGTTPYINIGDGGDEDAYLVLNAQGSDDWYFGFDTTSDDLLIGYGLAVGTTPRMQFADDSETITIGSTATNDTTLIFNSDAGGVLFYIADDNSEDDLVIGVGTTVDTTPAITVYGDTQIVEFEKTVAFKGGQTKETVLWPMSIHLDGTSAPALSDVGTDGQALVQALKFDADGGATGDDLVFINWIVPPGYVTDSLRLKVNWSFSAAETDNDDVVFDMTVNAVGAGENIDAAGTAFVQGDTNIATGATEGKLYQTTLNPEVEEIAVGDLVVIMFWVDEDASDLDASSTCDVSSFVLNWESTE